MVGTEFELLGELEEELLEDELEEETAELELLFPPWAGQYPASVLRALNSGAESAAVKLAVASGQRDENKLTNLVFFARHPERGGRKLARGEPGFALLTKEWVDIRNRVVRPALATAGAPPARPTTTGKAWVRELVPPLNRHRGDDIPLWFLIGWIAFESGGNIRSGTKLNERGYFQIHPGQSREILGLNDIDHNRLSTDREHSIKMGVRLVRFFMKRAQKLGFTPGTDLFWGMVKFQHWLPRGVQVILAHMKRNGFRASNWEEFKNYVLSNRLEFLRLIPAKAGTGWDPAAGIRSVDKAFQLGRALLPVAATS